MVKITLVAELLTSENFKGFGDVIDTNDKDFITINDGFAKKYKDLATIDTTHYKGTTAIHIFIAKQRKFPLYINMLENHPHFSQMFLPSTNTPFIVVVAPKHNKPNPETIKAFITSGTQGVNYAKGVWHFPLISLSDATQFFVVDRKASAAENINQCEIYNFKNTQILLECNKC